MARSFEEAQALWAAEQFSYRALNTGAYETKPEDTYTIESTIIYSGYCETCSYEAAGFSITNNRTRQSIKVETSYSEMVNAISRFAED